MKGYYVYTKKLANYLCRKGYKIIGNDINNQKPWLNVFIFDDSKELRNEIEKFKNGGKDNE